MDAANIVDVVSDFVTLKRAGANLKGLCPFHDDRTPSFMVSPSKNLCKCFACGVGGRPVDFIMRHENMTYPEALRYLAKKYGIPVQEKELTPEEKQSQNDRESMFILNEWARDWFRNQLNNTPDGRSIGLAYFRSRGFRDDILDRFQVGFSPNSRTSLLAVDALKAGYQQKYLVYSPNETDAKNSIGTGLCTQRDDGTLRDRYSGRVIWPIFTMSGRVAGFGGRVLDAATKGVAVKYMNSPESIVYSKRRELFGLFQAKQAISKQGFCYLVEGYTDVMGMHQAGVENVVASSGTALTKEQVRLIHRLTNDVVAIFDGDEAGIHASERGIDMFLADGMNVKLLLLPDGHDPDSFARQHTAEEFSKYLQEHRVDFIQYKVQHLMEEAQNDVTKMASLVHNVACTIAIIPDEITRELYIKQAARLLNFKEELISKAILQERQRLHDERQKEEARRRGLNTSSTPASPTDASPQNSPTPATSSDAEAPAQNQQMVQAQPMPEASQTLNSSAPAISQRRAAQEYVLAQMMMRYGEQVLFYMEDENGNDLPLSVLEYIQLSLQEVDVDFLVPQYARILSEGLQHVHDEGFTMQHYFMCHPDGAMSTLFTTLTMDDEPLSRYHGEIKLNQPLDELIPQVVSAIKLDLLKQKAADLQRQVALLPSTASSEERNALLRSFMETQQMMKQLSVR